MKKKLLFLICIPLIVTGQVSEKYPVDNDYVKGLIAKYKKEYRGPYKDLRWFCDDGTINPVKEPCENGGVQHARYTDDVVALGEKNHLYLGQILASTNFDSFWDETNDHSRLKQYMLEKYLRSIDDGWVNRRAQFYRGHVQSEDETEWGKNFFLWLLEKSEIVQKDFYLLREAAKDIPHSGDNNIAQLMRSQSKTLADAYPDFQNIRIKIHGQPTIEDISVVREFKDQNKDKLSASLENDFDELIQTMEQFFAPVNIDDLKTGLSRVSDVNIKNELTNQLKKLNSDNALLKIQSTSEAMWVIRENIYKETSAAGKLALLDLSIKLESVLISTAVGYKASTLKTLVDEVCFLSMASAASGYTELWEWNEIRASLNYQDIENITLANLNSIAQSARKQLDWGTSYNKAIFDEDIKRFEVFESKSSSFLDDRVRGSVALYLGNQLGSLSSFITDQEKLKNQVLDLKNVSHIRGLNPGYANGELIIVEGELRNLDVNPNNIYVFQRPPSDLRPVGGILNIAEGNLVSHLQLLARNLGIPNASISDDNLQELKKYNGQRVFYAVSNKGTVILKSEKDMTVREKDLFKTEVRNEKMIEVPVDKIQLNQTTILNLAEVDAKSSGVVCGPKAANLGELKKNFPEHVVDGFVIPFGIFRAHLEQKITGQDETYWTYLTGIYASARKMKSEGQSTNEIEKFQLGHFAKLSKMIMEMPLLPSFRKDLENSFTNILKKPFGEQPVFLRSDTNMEDLDSFTGAGLNLTLFNVREQKAIVAGIKEVWASPFSDRSYRWRQKYLNNPENVYPSIVVIPGVNNDCSGVMITKGVSSGNMDEITVAMSRGVGGAVEGQLAETWAIKNTGKHQLIAPSRELYFNSLKAEGGTTVKGTSLDTPILNSTRLQKINNFSKELIITMETKGMEGPYDVELGFKEGKIWLFQVRPFVENKNAISSEYLQSITPQVDQGKIIHLNTSI